MQGSTLAVWEIVLVAQTYELDVARTAEHLGWRSVRVQAALNYAAAFPEEMEAAMRDNAAMDFESLSRMLPQSIEMVLPENGAEA